MPYIQVEIDLDVARKFDAKSECECEFSDGGIGDRIGEQCVAHAIVEALEKWKDQ